MAFENLFVRTKKSIGGIDLDATITEGHVAEVRLTSNPVELGADITDNAIIEPKLLTIVAQVSDTPLGSAAFSQIVDTVTGLFGSATTSNLTRSQAAYEAMVQLMEAREPIEIQTKLKLYTNMMITNISTSQDKDSSRIVLMSISLKEVLIVESQIVSLSADSLLGGSPAEQGSPADDRGRQATTTPSSSTSL